MLVNLHRPYGTGYSVAKDNMTFYNKVNDDFIYKKGDKIEIYVAPTQKTTKLKWKLCKNLINKPFETGYAEALPGYIFKITIDAKGFEAGYYDIHCEAEFGTGATAISACSASAWCTFGYDVENMTSRMVKPDDFLEFWANSKKKLDGIELDMEFGEVYTFKKKQVDDYNVAQASFPCSYDEEGVLYDEVISYKVSFMSASGIRIYGYFARPKQEGKYPGLMIYPGAGFHSRSMPLEHARHGYAALDIQVHGQDVDWERDKYVPTKVSIDYEDERHMEKHYYNDIYMHALQAINALCSLEGVDSERIAVCGGSQGGRLSVVASALDKRVRAAVLGIPHYNGLPYIHWAYYENQRGGNGERFDLSIVDMEKLNAIGYYDTTNFAKEVKCPIIVGCGLIDGCSPATCVRTLFNELGSENKTYIPSPMMGHDWDAEFDRRAWRWLKDILG